MTDLRDPACVQLASMFSSSFGLAAEKTCDLSVATARDCLESAARAAALEDLGRRAHDFSRLASDCIDDDEVFNWTIPDVVADFAAGIWNIASGHFKTAASCMRSALDLGFVSLYFHIREATTSSDTSWSQEFISWDSGAQTPGWRTTRATVDQWAPVSSFDSLHGLSITDLVHGQFYELSAFTHSRAYAPSGRASTMMNMGYTSGSFDPVLFSQFVDLAADTIAWLATVWLVAFPSQLDLDPLGEGLWSSYEGLLRHSTGQQAIAWAAANHGQDLT